MKAIETPTTKQTKAIMVSLLNCVKDKSLPIAERNQYYSEYLQLAKNLLILSK